MKIAHVTATFPPYLGGTGNVCAHHALGLAQRGHQVDVYTLNARGIPPQEQYQGLRVTRLQPRLKFGNAGLVLPGAWKLNAYDLLHFHYPFIGGEGAILNARRAHIPVVVTYHQDILLRGWQGGVEWFIRQTLGRWSLRAAHTLLFTSADYGQASHARPLLKGSRVHIGAVPNGVDCQVFHPNIPTTLLQAKWQLQPNDFVVLLVARLDQAHYFKGVPVLLEALTHTPHNVKAILVGEGDLLPAYQSRAYELQLAERVIFTGRVTDEELPAYYNLADVTVLPSTTMGEAFGLVLAESLACATPVIASNLPGVRTVVTDDVDGYLVEPGDPLNLLARIKQVMDFSTEQRQAMGQVGRRKVLQQYTWERIAEQLEKTYRSVLVAN